MLEQPVGSMFSFKLPITDCFWYISVRICSFLSNRICLSFSFLTFLFHFRPTKNVKVKTGEVFFQPFPSVFRPTCDGSMFADDMDRQVEARDSDVPPPCGDMAPTLQDVAYLLDLPFQGEVVDPQVIPQDCLSNLKECFTVVVKHPRVGADSATPQG
jgi:hypothetical protein